MNDKQQLAAIGKKELAEKNLQDAGVLKATDDKSLCMAKRIEDLEVQVRGLKSANLSWQSEMEGLNAKFSAALELLREATEWMEDHPAMPDSSRMRAVLSGKLPEPAVREGLLLIGYRNHSSPNGLRRFMTPKQYGKQTDGIKKWYDPVYAAPVPDGWQLVPVEVTLPMQHAYFGVIDKNMKRVETDCRFGRYDSAKEAYRAMLAAAPKPDSVK